MSFFCPHFDQPADGCRKLKLECVPGRPGCVLRGKVAFATPAEDRVKKRAPKPPATKGVTPWPGAAPRP